MNSLSKKILCLTAAVLLLLVGAQAGFGQNVTSGTITGVVMDAQKGVLPGATVTAVHTPTGTTYEAVTQADGRFTMQSVRVGGPYTVKVTMSGFKTEEQTGIQVSLGEVRDLTFTLAIASVSETVNVTAEAQVIDTQRAGTASNISDQAIESLPTINRSINDFARTSPYFNVTADSAGGQEFISVAGRNNRYNNMQIDGAVNNDVFGLAATGTPGGQTSTQPISLDAIQEIQLLVSPYDVRQGGFSGGGINAITKSGTNAFHGGAYYVGRNQDLIGKIYSLYTPSNFSPTLTKVGPFSDKQFGGTLGGPIWKNKAFFFFNADWARKSTPVGYSLDGSSGQQFAKSSDVEQVLQIAQNQYGYDAGNTGEFSKPNNSNKFFGRVDFNLGSNHQLTWRENYVDALADIGSSSARGYTMPTNYYHMTDKMLSSVVQLNSSFGRLFNELRVVYQRERNKRGGQPGVPDFPAVTVYLSDPSYSVTFGTEYSSMANQLNQDIVQVSDDVTWVRGAHTVQFGMQNEFYKFYNLFIQNLFGSYTFASIANFQKGIAGGYYHYFSNDPNNPLTAADWSVSQWGFYVGDKWRVKPDFTLTYGARIDIPHFPDTPGDNPISMTDFGYSTAVVPSPKMFSPRVGFNWDLSHGTTARKQLRGGVGIFTGRTPYVWLSNQYTGTGLQFTNLSVSYNSTNSIAFNPDPYTQATTIGSSGRQSISLIDPNYKYPEIVRSNLALDHDLPLGMVGTAEFLYTKTLKDINYQNLNYQVTSTLITGQTIAGKVDSGLNDVMLLSNTSAGHSWTMTFSAERPYRHGFYFKASYLYGRAYTVNDGTSSVARSNWSNNPYQYNTNTPAESRSNFDPGHRVNFAMSVDLPRFYGVTHQLALFYNGMTGRRYSQGWAYDINGDGARNELLWVPSSPNQVILTGGTWQQLDAYLSSDPCTSQYRGQVVPRNCGRSPWQNQMDIQYALNIPTGGKTKAELTVTVFNFLNMLNRNWGWQYWGAFGSNQLISTSSGVVDPATGKVKYNFSTITGSGFQGTFYRDDLRSRWQMQLGARFRF